MPLSDQVAFLFLLALPIACVAWTVTHEEIFREPREYCKYCFSHLVALFFLLITQYKLLFADWRGYLIGYFALVWVSNLYMNLYARIRLEIRRERTEIALEEKAAKAIENESESPPDPVRGYRR